MAAQALGIHERRAGVTPIDKIARIDDLTRHGFKVMMVGDGTTRPRSPRPMPRCRR